MKKSHLKTALWKLLIKGKYNFVKQLLLNLHNSENQSEGIETHPNLDPKPSASGFGSKRRRKRSGTDARRKEGEVERRFLRRKVKLIRAQGECLGIRSR